MNKSDFLKKILRDVFGTTKISTGKYSDDNLDRNSGYFLKCNLSKNSCTRFNKLFDVSLNIEKSKYEKINGHNSVIDKIQIINNFGKYIFDSFGIIIYDEIKPDKNNPELNKYKYIIINITNNIISPKLFMVI